MQEESTILVASRDPRLADVRKGVLESAGFHVIPAPDIATVEKACSEHRVRAVMIGYSLPPAEKRRIWAAARKTCKAPILELYQSGTPELLEQNVFAHRAETPDDFLEALKKILENRN